MNEQAASHEFSDVATAPGALPSWGRRTTACSDWYIPIRLTSP